MSNNQKSTEVQQQARQRQMTKIGETWHISDPDVAKQTLPAKQTRCVFASVNGYAQAEVVTTQPKRG